MKNIRNEIKSWPTWGKWAAGILVLVVIGVLAGGGSSSEQGDGDQGSAKAAPAPKDASAKTQTSVSATKAKPESCGRKATDGCTPHVQSDENVRVDAMIWRVLGTRTATTLGNEFTRERADGRYVVVKLKVHSDRDESATLDDDIVKLRIGDTTYGTDTDGTVAVQLSGGDGNAEAFFLKDLGPDSTTRGVVVFDVPASKIGRKMELEFHELGYGSTKGYIMLPPLA